MKGKFFVMMFVIILLVGTVSAFEFDNVKRLNWSGNGNGGNGNGGNGNGNGQYPNIEIVNGFGLGATLWSGELTNNSDVWGQDCYAIKEITYLKKVL